MENTEIAEALFAAFAGGDADAAKLLCTPDFKGTQNHGPPMDLDSLLEFSLAVGEIVNNFRYENAVRAATADGFVEEHLVRGTLPDGSELNLAACVVAQVRDGRVSELREYLDSASARGLIKALTSR